MKSRYSAFVVGNAPYIIKTTHPTNPDYQLDRKEWQKSIETFCKESNFISLEIKSYHEEPMQAFVTFKAYFTNGELYEKSRFVKEEGRWVYVDGEFI